MKTIGLRFAVQAAILAAVFAAGGRSDGADTAAHPRGEVQAKAEYCKDCHGLSGQGYRGYLPIPRLAGQQPDYIENQLRAFVERRRDRNLFLDMAHVHGLSPGLRSGLASHFHSLNSRPIGGAPKHLVATGRKIFEEGIPEANVPACSACHGPDGKGQDAIPRLAGQLYPYTVKELTSWGKERGQGDDTTAVMAKVSHNLSNTQIDAIAAFLSYQE